MFLAFYQEVKIVTLTPKSFSLIPTLTTFSHTAYNEKKSAMNGEKSKIISSQVWNFFPFFQRKKPLKV